MGQQSEAFSMLPALGEYLNVHRQLFLLMLLPLTRVWSAAIALKEITYQMDMSQEHTINNMASIIDALENLGVLESTHTTCYSVDKIVRIEDLVNKHDWKVSVDLFIRELGKSGTDTGKDPQSSMDDISDCIHGSSSTQLPNVYPVSENYNSSSSLTSNNESLTANNTQTKVVKTVEGKHYEGGLSKTQILVISTCSTVIGLFFIVALIMRVRNYIKRINAEKRNRKVIHRSNLSPNASHHTSHESNLHNHKQDGTIVRMQGPVGVKNNTQWILKSGL